jgi:CheY-like chemotaxis protein
MSPEFQYIAATIQAHEKRIEEYIASAAPDVNLIDRMRSLPRIWENSLLVVDDDRQMRELLTRALDRYGHVTCAENGDAALKMIQQRFFNAIITDVDMPVLDGISLLRQTIHENDHLHGHFILCTGNTTEEVLTAVREYEVPLL